MRIEKVMPLGNRTLIHTFSLTLVSILALLFLPEALHAERFIRVCKKGVICYYFSNRPTPTSHIATYAGRGRIKLCASTAGRRRSARELEPLIEAASRRHNLPPALIKAVIRVESNFNPAATSPKGAQGLMQLMPGTAEQLQVSDPYDVQENIHGGTRYLRMLLEKFGFKLPLALAAYNAGPQRVEKRQDVPNIPETQAFVRDVCRNYLQYDRQN
ncbi:lytic transglycosylase domain-containing protein [Desulfobacca acetoxidans]|uniref:Lytic transglycosylase catalytic n=1 Tax=Desulfobacca acetoxidans (strain ATCC 700848 / DSM 11109 / ASRB2) TaxID=880072 RepID=F2NDR6_DESAR|nr:lytic transglycosylase domain-containing protein [Desulfobacca acetoxidans]AEB10413.1 Lytic transglycosylase catalytic [Desulfobacca acetoxidans DSM 11109]